MDKYFTVLIWGLDIATYKQGFFYTFEEAKKVALEHKAVGRNSEVYEVKLKKVEH